MRKSKIVHVKCDDLVHKDKSINTEALDLALDSISRDAKKVNKKNYLAARRFRVNTVELEKAMKIAREGSPVKKKKKKEEDK